MPPRNPGNSGKRRRHSPGKDNQRNPSGASRKSRDGNAFEKKQGRPASDFKKKSSRKGSGKSDSVRSANSSPQNLIEASGSELIRLNKYIANSGVCSRREADEHISHGLITVNGKTITELGYKVHRDDKVRYDGKLLRAEKPVYILLNKPKGYLTTTKDPKERKTIMELVAGSVKERIYPVGRLDRNTTGLILLTNDGEIAERLSHPSYEVKKIYKVELNRPLSKEDYQKIMDGIHLEEGKVRVDDLAVISDDGKTVGMELHIGWNRVVRRIFEALEYEVVKLDRSVYAGLDKRDLPRGHWRFLKPVEVIRLKQYGKKS